MSSTYKNLQELRKSIDLQVEGLEKYPTNGPSIIIANHSCLKDIFYLPAALPEEIISLISGRLIYKNEHPRKDIVNHYLNAMPIEAHGGVKYIEACLTEAAVLLKSGLSLSIFPEGAYVADQSVIYRGRTGAARLVVTGFETIGNVHLLPVAISYQEQALDLDSYDLQPEKVTLTILNPINCAQESEAYFRAQTPDLKNAELHKIVDKGMSAIAKALSKEYLNNYIILRPKGNVMFPDGSTIVVDEAQNHVDEYKDMLSKRGQQLVRKIKERK